MAAAERSSAPLAQKNARCSQLRRHHAAGRGCRRRIDASTLDRHNGSGCTILVECVFSRRAVYGRAGMPTKWSWERGRLGKLAKDTTLGLDGLGHTHLREYFGRSVSHRRRLGMRRADQRS